MAAGAQSHNDPAAAEPESRLLQSLRAAVRAHPTAEKILVVTDITAGLALVHSLARSGTAVANLRVVTPLLLASEQVAADLTGAGLAGVSGAASLLMAEQALAGEKATPGGYLAAVPMTPGLVDVIHRAIQELRLAGFTAATLPVTAFAPPGKGQALVRLLSAYEAGLAERGLVDAAAILTRALAKLPGAHCGPVYLLPEGLVIGPGLVRRFLEERLAGQALVLRRDPVQGLTAPAACWPLPSAANPGAAAATGADAPPARDGARELFAAAGEHNEVREVLRRVLQAGAPFDAVELVVTDAAAYTRAIHEVAAGLGVPCTFAGGLPVSYTRPGRALTAYLDWVARDYLARPIWQALAGGDLVVPDAGDHGGRTYARLLRAGGVGWGRSRWETVLAEALAAAELALAAADVEAAEPADDDDAAAGRGAARRNGEGEVDALRRLQGFAAALLEWTPAPGPGGTVPLSALCQGAEQVLARAAGIAGPLDAAASTVLAEVLAEAAAAPAGDYPLPAAAERLRSLVAGATVGQSGPQPGQIHVTDVATAGWSGRTEVYLLGLDHERFPGAGLPDPVLPDHERAALGAGALALAADRPARQRYQLAQALAGLRGRLCASYSAVAPGEDRLQFPSSALLQIERLRTGDAGLDYSDLLRRLGPPVGYLPQPGRPDLDEHDWWLRGLAPSGGPLADGSPLLPLFYPDLATGMAAAAARAGPDVTPHDGWVTADPDRLDPRRNRERVLSASTLETLATCPLRYFFRYVLGLQPPDEVEFDPTRWLDAAQRGQLLHDVFCRFLSQLQAAGTPRPEPGHLTLLQGITAAAIAEWRVRIPPPSEPVAAAEAAELQRSAALFLRAEVADPPGGEPYALELDFGFETTNPVTVTTAAGGTLRIRGRIDRVDHLGGSRYAIWDYKTGGSAPYSGRHYFRRGRQLQHALYALAAEQVLRQSGADPAATVVQAGYYFPTERGEGEQVARPQDRRADLSALLDHLCDLAGQGVFVAAEDAGARACTYCDFAAACGGQRTAEQTDHKLTAAPNPVLDPLRRIAGYE